MSQASANLLNLTFYNKQKSSAPKSNRSSNGYQTRYKSTKSSSIKLLREEEKEKAKHMEKSKILNGSTEKMGKMGFWLNVEMLLQEIDVQHEKFEIFTWFDIYWKDNNNDKLESLFLRDNKTEFVSICYNDLNDEIKDILPFQRHFLLNAVDTEYLDCFIKKWDKNKVDNVYILHFVFKAAVNERFELDEFPFDAQFLNLKIRFNQKLFYFLSICPEWISLYDKLNKIGIFELNITDSIESIWFVESPIIDFRSKKGEYNIPFHLIRLRVIRNPSFYILNGIIPLFLVVSCSFAQIVIDNNDLGDKLEYVVTLLLTVAAFQYAFSADLPQTSETTYIDYYILCSYLILSSMVLQIATIPNVDYNYYILSLSAIIWLIASLFFVYKWLHKINANDWRRRSIEEFQEWDLNYVQNDHFHKPSISDIKGTRDISDPSFQPL